MSNFPREIPPRDLGQKPLHLAQMKPVSQGSAVDGCTLVRGYLELPGRTTALLSEEKITKAEIRIAKAKRVMMLADDLTQVIDVGDLTHSMAANGIFDAEVVDLSLIHI